MSGPSDIGGFVSSDSDNMIRNPAANAQTSAPAGSVWNWLCCCELQLVKLIRNSNLNWGQLDSRKYYEPSAPRRIPFLLLGSLIVAIWNIP